MGVFASFFSFLKMLTKKQIQDRALAEASVGEAPLCGGGFVEGATWANDQNAAEIDALKEARDILVCEIGAQRAELIAALQSIKTATDEHRADMEDWVYNSIVAILKKYE